MRARARLISGAVHDALAVGDVIEDDEVEVDLLFAVSVGGLQSVGPGVGQPSAMNDQGRR